VGNITAAEQIIFLTESLRLRETLNRVLQDCMSTELLTHIINQHRTCPKYPVKANSVCKILQFTMQDENQEKWTVGKHKKGLIKGEKKWPEDKMTLADLDVNCETKHLKRNPPIDNIPFEAIAVDVARLPSGDDALDLTHCLTWVLNNPGSGLLWPRDFEWLIEKLGGAQPVAAVNRDKAVFERWEMKLKAYKKVKRVLKSNATKAEAKMQTLKTKKAMLCATAKYEEASAALKTLAQAPPALASAVNGGIVINTALIPPPVLVQMPLPSRNTSLSSTLSPWMTASRLILSPVLTLQKTSSTTLPCRRSMMSLATTFSIPLQLWRMTPCRCPPTTRIRLFPCLTISTASAGPSIMVSTTSISHSILSRLA
jgi:hypothetical protein